MTNRAQRGDGPDDRAADEAWERFGTDAAATGDFWADVPDWSGTASTSRRSARGLIGGDDQPTDPTPIRADHPARPDGAHRVAAHRLDESPTGDRAVGGIRGAWQQLLGAGAEPTRAHRRPDPSQVHTSSSDPGAASTVRPDARPAIDDAAAPRQRLAERTPMRGTEQGWIDDPSVAGRRRETPIDPLLARLGAIVIVVTLAVPLAISLASGDDGLDSALSSSSQVAAPSSA
ncbi:MAG: hypothetical protein AAGG08_07795, partial [Actinomycetota bacterium]